MIRDSVNISNPRRLLVDLRSWALVGCIGPAVTWAAIYTGVADRLPPYSALPATLLYPTALVCMMLMAVKSNVVAITIITGSLVANVVIFVAVGLLFRFLVAMAPVKRWLITLAAYAIIYALTVVVIYKLL